MNINNMKKTMPIILTTLLLSYSSMLFAANGNIANSLAQCYQEIGDNPRTQIADCLKVKLVVAEKNMNESLLKARESLAAVDSSATKPALESLATSQKDFIVYRNSECQRQSDTLLGGSGAGDIYLACQIEQTEMRTKTLQEK
ncbi:UmoC family flagellar biogenesis regulator [Providencia vermicola]|uniref:DUF1311 domain-containing protein n=2 Tax=Providencia TaxID=586 RepID=A0ABD5L9P1_PROST|nr:MULTISPECIES: lysozyme inhibitor LprI family protein [Providencia]ELR5045528.1 DUF1311 domain-containing protein [Providencia rettgeri]ELR5143534.1 DUF1311 domain-containing protein [Providencia stuartii]ELR5292219.1 DUF1311 domain-containing protein [Providencia stuartii]ELX8378731.1 DUF1311 domain-containing protein [Providencia stuartii]ELZ5940038.1 DUF1311 domain-containing protein [Providencia stuartii]